MDRALALFVVISIKACAPTGPDAGSRFELDAGYGQDGGVVLDSGVPSCLDAGPDVDGGPPSDAGDDRSLDGGVLYSPVAAPPRPVWGWQTIERIGGVESCSQHVMVDASRWARSAGLSVSPIYQSSVALDVEFLPIVVDGVVANKSVEQFVRECVLFETYAGSLEMTQRLRTYLVETRLDPSVIDSKELVKRGFSLADAAHLGEHLARFGSERYLAVGSSKLAGITYIRLTYSSRPESEVSVTTGTLPGRSLSSDQLDLMGALMSVVKVAASCGSSSR